MPENNFEKKVQNLMDELKFKPSEEVWPAINKRIQRKRRHRFIFFLLPVMSALLVTGYIFYKNNSHPVVKNLTEQTPVKIQTQESDIISDPTSIQTSIENAGNGISNDEKANAITSKHNINKSVTDQSINASTTQKNFPMPFQQSKPLDIKKEITLTDDYLVINKPDEKTNVLNGINDEELTLNENEPLNFNHPVTRDNNPVQVLDHSIFLDTEKKIMENVFDTDIKMPELIFENAVVKKSSSKWKLGFHVTAGSAKTGNKALPGIQSETLSMDFSNAPSAGGPLYTRPPQIYTRPPQNAKAGVSVEMGIILQKQITERSSIMGGLQYFYANDHLLAGTQYGTSNQLQFASSTLERRYYTGNDDWYTNHYHFIELPVQYGYLLNKKSNLPVRLHVGLILSQLISTNGIIYDPALSGVYFQDKKQFNHTGLSLSSGLSFAFNQNKKLKWSAGPQIRAGLNNLRKSSYDHNQYLLSGGIQFKLFID